MSPVSSLRQRQADVGETDREGRAGLAGFQCRHQGRKGGGVGEEQRADGGSCCSLGVTYRRGRHICNSWQASKGPMSHYYQQQDASRQDVCTESSAVSSRASAMLAIISTTDSVKTSFYCTNKYIMRIIISYPFYLSVKSGAKSSN